MKIVKAAIAGTLESSDAMVQIEPGEGSLELSMHSTLMRQYGRQNREVILETLRRLGVENAKVTIHDKGALECTLKARVEAAVLRAADGQNEQISWGGNIR